MKKLNFWILWIVFQISSYFGIGLIEFSTITLWQQTRGLLSIVGSFLAGVIIGLVVGRLQWQLLIRRLAPIDSWSKMTSVSYSLGALLSIICFTMLPQCRELLFASNVTGTEANDQLICAILVMYGLMGSVGLILLLAMGLQSFSLRKSVKRYWYWFVGNIAGVALSLIAGSVVGFLDQLPYAAIFVAGFIVHILVTGFAMRGMLIHASNQNIAHDGSL